MASATSCHTFLPTAPSSANIVDGLSFSNCVSGSGNQFEEIPLAVKQVPSLSVLRLHDNLLKCLADEDVTYLKSLKKVSLEGNPLTSGIVDLVTAK
jgi:hypothetical protein